MIVRILQVDEWRERYLDRVRELALVELEWEKLGGRIAVWRDLIVEDVARDPFLGDRQAFLQSLEGPTDSLKSNAAERRSFLLEHPSLQKSPDS